MNVAGPKGSLECGCDLVAVLELVPKGVCITHLRDGSPCFHNLFELFVVRPTRNVASRTYRDRQASLLDSSDQGHSNETLDGLLYTPERTQRAFHNPSFNPSQLFLSTHNHIQLHYRFARLALELSKNRSKLSEGFGRKPAVLPSSSPINMTFRRLILLIVNGLMLLQESIIAHPLQQASLEYPTNPAIPNKSTALLRRNVTITAQYPPTTLIQTRLPGTKGVSFLSPTVRLGGQDGSIVLSSRADRL